MNNYAQESYHKSLKGEVEQSSQNLGEARAKLERFMTSIKDKKKWLESILGGYYHKSENQIQLSMAKVFRSNKIIANVCSLAAAWLASSLVGVFSYNTAAFPKGVPWWWIFFGLLICFVAFYTALRFLSKGLAMFGLRVDFNKGESIAPLFKLVKWSGISFLATFAVLMASVFLINSSELVIIAQIMIEIELTIFSGTSAVLSGFFGHVYNVSEELEAMCVEHAKIEANLPNLERAYTQSENQLQRFQYAMATQAVSAPMLNPKSVNHGVHTVDTHHFDFE